MRNEMLQILRLGFIHLCQLKFRHGFKDTFNPLCSCSIKTETATTQYFLPYHFYNSNQQATLISFCMVSYRNLISFLLHGDDKFDNTIKKY